MANFSSGAEAATTALAILDARLQAVDSSTKIELWQQWVFQQAIARQALGSGSVTTNTAIAYGAGATDAKTQRVVASNEFALNWTTLRTWDTPTTPSAFNSRPSIGGAASVNEVCNFLALTGFSASSANQIEVLVKLKTTSAASWRAYLWVKDPSINEDICLTPLGATSGENALSSFDTNGAYYAATPILVDLKRYVSGMLFQVRVLLDVATNTFDSLGGCVNVGFAVGELVSFSTSGVLPRGLSANTIGFDFSANTYTYAGASFADTEPLRFNFQTLPTAAIPPVGISSAIKCADVSTSNSTITFDGRNTQVSFANGDLVRFKTPTGSTFPTVGGAVINVNATYTLINVTGSTGSQTAQISTDGVTPLQITAYGLGLFYCYKYPFINVFQKGSNQLSYSSGGAAIDFKALYEAQSVTVTTAGSASTITQAGHAYSAGQELILGGTTAPTGGILGNKYYVLASGLVAGTSYQVGNVAGGAPISFSGAGTGVTFAPTNTSIPVSVTVSIGTAGVITVGSTANPVNHFMGVAQYLTLAGSPAPTGYPSSGLFISATALTNTTFTFSDVRGGAQIILGSTGTTVTMMAALTGIESLEIEKTQAYVQASADTFIAFSNTNGGAAISMNGGFGLHSITPSTSPVITSGTVYARAL